VRDVGGQLFAVAAVAGCAFCPCGRICIAPPLVQLSMPCTRLFLPSGLWATTLPPRSLLSFHPFAFLMCCLAGSSSRLRATASFLARWRSLPRSSGWRCRRSGRCVGGLAPFRGCCACSIMWHDCQGGFVSIEPQSSAACGWAGGGMQSPAPVLGHAAPPAHCACCTGPGVHAAAASQLGLFLGVPNILQARKVPEQMEDLIEFFLDTGGELGCLRTLGWRPAPCCGAVERGCKLPGGRGPVATCL